MKNYSHVIFKNKIMNIKNILKNAILKIIKKENLVKKDSVLKIEKGLEYNIEDKMKLNTIDDSEKLNEKSNVINEVDSFESIIKNQENSELFVLEEKDKESKSNIVIENLNLSTRSKNALLREGIECINDILNFTKEDIYMIKNLGKKSAEEIIEKVENLGFILKEKEPEYLESEELGELNIEYNMIMSFRLLEKIFGTNITRKFDQNQEKEFYKRLENSLNTLNEREKYVLIERFGLISGQTKTLEDIAYLQGITRERVRQIEIKSLKKLKELTRTRILREYIKFEDKSNDDLDMINYVLDCAKKN